MKFVIGAIALAVPLMLGSASATADPWKDESDHGRHAKHWTKHAEKEWRHERKRWDKNRRHAERLHYREGRREHYRRDVVVRHYAAPHVAEHHYYAVPPRAYAPAPGVHIVMPDVYIPF